MLAAFALQTVVQKQDGATARWNMKEGEAETAGLQERG